jgi:NAD(P)-dependent dehydrogenase (short-subunit alcohol dehydrogenase family)
MKGDTAQIRAYNIVMERQSTEGKTILITGATSGIGLAGAKLLSKNGANLIMTARENERGDKAVREVFKYSKNNKIELFSSDLASFESINNFINELTKKTRELNILINNAGIWEPNFKVTVDGIESNFAVNHLGPYLLTNLILKKLKEMSVERIINTASEAHRGVYINLEDIEMKNDFNGYRAYSQSKLANILFTKKLASLLRANHTTVNCFHPGVVRTHLFDHLNTVQQTIFSPFLIPPRRGAETMVYLASSPDLDEVTGEYFNKKKLVRPSIEANNEEVADRLWEISYNYVKKYL